MKKEDLKIKSAIENLISAIKDSRPEEAKKLEELLNSENLKEGLFDVIKE